MARTIARDRCASVEHPAVIDCEHIAGSQAEDVFPGRIHRLREGIPRSAFRSFEASIREPV
ncbi:hypothetical protein Hoch_2861 [Haliangium ochraceum DSM 14365]|uniref:Uncharacterized protein n=1 Tax=Haliangium ochraceum (strain DSM 14365 / JCM 11303 / SMP-2) TaxID=502025 RepID=D0LPM2_HALO1|nr:hypothetical protein Hoch_2861 [Haliangium ochraceum DSM 14365]